MRYIQLGSSVGCLRVPQVHFVRKHFVQKQAMCKSVYTYLTICFAFEKPRWLLHNTADRAETVFSHLNTAKIVCLSGFNNSDTEDLTERLGETTNQECKKSYAPNSLTKREGGDPSKYTVCVFTKGWQGWQGWPSGESTCLPPMWPGFDFRTRRHMWVEFVGSLLCYERFFPGYSGFPLSPKTNI